MRNLRWFFQIRPTARPGHYHYRIPLPFPFWLPCCGQERTFGYEGEVDDTGKPHGLGTWTDDAYHGECLQGVWQHGRPIGPFRGSEYHSDYRFCNLRLAFAHNRADADSPLSWWRPTYSKDGLHWGVASLEQSVAGAWFKALPHPEVLCCEPMSSSVDASWCLEQLIALRPDTQAPSITISAADGELIVEKHQMVPGADPSKVTIELVPTHMGSTPPSRAASSSNIAACASGTGLGGSGGGGVPASLPAAPSALTNGGSTPAMPTGGRADGGIEVTQAGSSGGGGGESGPASGDGKEGGGEGGGEGGVFFTPLSEGGSASGGGVGGPLSLGLGHGLGHAHGHGWDETVSHCSYRPNTFSHYREHAVGDGDDHDVDDDELAGHHGRRSRSASGERIASGGRWAANGRGASGRASEFDEQPLLQRTQLPSTVLRVADRVPWEKAPPEVLLYVPGFNASIVDSVSTCGQLLCLADFPPNLKTFMFSWPGGRGLTYYSAINHAAHERNQIDFARFFASIIDSGVREIHILCHSVGAHVLFSALHRIAPMLQTCEQQTRLRNACSGGLAGAADAMPKARIATCLIMSPDYPIQRFIRHDFNLLRKLCSCITLYCDKSDGALNYSEIFNQKKALGKNPFELVREPRPGDVEEGGAGGGSSGVRLPTRVNSRAQSVGAPGGVGAPAPTASSSGFSATGAATGVLSYIATLGEYMGESVPAMFRQSSALDTDLSSGVRQKGDPLDMDVIDSSWMDANVQGLRHNYFNVNRYMIDDIREIISTKRRAHLRTGRLTHRRGNVWSFLAAPKYIVNH